MPTKKNACTNCAKLRAENKALRAEIASIEPYIHDVERILEDYVTNIFPIAQKTSEHEQRLRDKIIADFSTQIQSLTQKIHKRHVDPALVEFLKKRLDASAPGTQLHAKDLLFMVMKDKTLPKRSYNSVDLAMAAAELREQHPGKYAGRGYKRLS